MKSFSEITAPTYGHFGGSPRMAHLSFKQIANGLTFGMFKKDGSWAQGKDKDQTAYRLDNIKAASETVCEEYVAQYESNGLAYVRSKINGSEFCNSVFYNMAKNDVLKPKGLYDTNWVKKGPDKFFKTYSWVKGEIRKRANEFLYKIEKEYASLVQLPAPTPPVQAPTPPPANVSSYEEEGGKKNNTLLIVAIAAAVVAFFYFKKK